MSDRVSNVGNRPLPGSIPPVRRPPAERDPEHHDRGSRKRGQDKDKPDEPADGDERKKPLLDEYA